MLNELKPNVIYISDFSRNILENNLEFQHKSFYVENNVEIMDRKNIIWNYMYI